MQALHDEMGHQGRDRTINLVRERFYGPGMTKDIEQWVSNCKNCIKRKTKPDVAPLVNIQTFQPLELVCLDFLSLEQSKGGHQNILVITDHFTKFAQAYPTKNNKLREQPIFFTMSTSVIMEFRRICVLIRVLNI